MRHVTEAYAYQSFLSLSLSPSLPLSLSPSLPLSLAPSLPLSLSPSLPLSLSLSPSPTLSSEQQGRFDEMLEKSRDVLEVHYVEVMPKLFTR